MELVNNIKKLEKAVKDRLTWDDRIDETQIDVSIEGNIAILKGCVFAYPEKVLAEIEAQIVPGIKSIVNDIEVKFPRSYEIPTDQDVKESMFCLFDANSEINSNEIEVSINNGNIKLEGTVNSYWKKEKIYELSSHVPGVVSVSNKISVVPDKEISDAEIAEAIFILIQNSVHIDAHKVDVKVKDGVVTLSGILSSFNEYDAVRNIVKFTKGVIDIKNNLKWIYRYYTT
jgi:osmotically-inducible protein OsmY